MIQIQRFMSTVPLYRGILISGGCVSSFWGLDTIYGDILLLLRFGTCIYILSVSSYVNT